MVYILSCKYKDAYILMNKDVAILMIRMASYVEQGPGHRGNGVVLFKGTCYELVNLSLSYDSNLCVNYQAKSSSTEIQVKATIS